MRPNCEQVAELLTRFVSAQRVGERVASDVMDQADSAIHELLAPPTQAEIVELCALGSSVGAEMLTKVREANAARN